MYDLELSINLVLGTCLLVALFLLYVMQAGYADVCDELRGEIAGLREDLRDKTPTATQATTSDEVTT